MTEFVLFALYITILLQEFVGIASSLFIFDSDMWGEMNLDILFK